MLNPRQRRLEVDYRELRNRFDADEHITIQAIGLAPAERFHVLYKVPTLYLDDQGRVMERRQTVVEITLPAAYPREKPHATAFDPVFHPNFGAYICIADFWSPTNSLVDVVRDIGLMLQWQKYNIRSPLNAAAAEWSQDRQHELPIGHIDFGFRPVELTIIIDI